MTGSKLVANLKIKLHTSWTAHSYVTDDSLHLCRTANVFKIHEKYARALGWKVYKDLLEDKDINGTIILKEMLKKMNLRLRTGFSCFTGETSNETSGLRYVTLRFTAVVFQLTICCVFQLTICRVFQLTICRVFQLTIRCVFQLMICCVFQLMICCVFQLMICCIFQLTICCVFQLMICCVFQLMICCVFRCGMCLVCSDISKEVATFIFGVTATNIWFLKKREIPCLVEPLLAYQGLG